MTEAFDPVAIQSLLQYATEEEAAQIAELLRHSAPVWAPLPGPQTEAYNTEADILFFGGSAGGGKTGLLIGTSLTRHSRTMIFRRQATELQGGIIDDLAKIVGNYCEDPRQGFNGTYLIWRIPKAIAPDCQIEFGSCPNPLDEVKYRGRPHDLLGFDEIQSFLESQFRFLIGWLRTTKKGQRCRIICTGNPPESAEGEWVIRFWSPWLDPDHPNPAKPGELRFFAVIDGKDYERPHGKPFYHKCNYAETECPYRKRCHSGRCPEGGEYIVPMSRTFIPSHVEDNPFLMQTGYKQSLQALPEPLRSQMLLGKFNVRKTDDLWQLFPTDWIEAAQKRWTPDGHKGKPMDAMGVDVARGGGDETSLSRRHATWFNETLNFPGAATPDGNSVAGLCIMNMKNGARINIDIIGVGGSAYDHLNNNSIPVFGVDARKKGHGTDKSGLLRFKNYRAEICWRFRELLDPENENPIALPPSANLKRELCAFRWLVTSDKDGSVIQVGDKDDIRVRLQGSPNEAEAVIYASIPTPEKTEEARMSAIEKKLAEKVGGSGRSAMSS